MSEKSVFLNLKRTVCALAAVLMCFSTAACGSESEDFKAPEAFTLSEDGVVAKNAGYSLEYDSYTSSVLLRDLQTDYVWCTTPYNSLVNDEGPAALNSALAIEYYDMSDSSMQTDKSYTCVSDCTVSSETVEDGICVTYYFSTAETLIPVYFTLEDNGLRATVKANEIKESGKCKLISVTLAPYLCSAANVDDKSAYLLLPTGSGALMYTDEEITRTARTYQGEVYGADAARQLLDNVENEQSVTMPIFGVRNTDGNGMLAIIDKGAESARIDASAGSVKYGYSNVCAAFYVRGFDEIEQIIGSWRAEALALAESCSQQAEYSVCYYPLNGEAATYNGMASFYREYLKADNSVTTASDEQKTYSVEIVGGALVKKFFLGVPYKTVASLTSFKEALNLIEELNEIGSPNIVLSGYGESGADIGKVAGGYGFSKKLGSEREHGEIEAYCKQNGINLFTDFELAYYGKSGNGFTTMLGAAKTANLKSASVYPLKVNNRMPDESADKKLLLKRSLLNKAVDKLIKYTEKGIGGLSLGSLGSVAYSDYQSEETYMKAGMAEQVRQLVDSVSNAGHRVCLRSANSYAAGIADAVTDVPLDNGGYTVFDETIPFYSMVFGGSTALYSTPINYASNRNKALLRAVEAGVSPSFKIIKNHNAEVSDSYAEYFYAAEYAAVKDYIRSTVERTADYYKAISGAAITEHTLICDGVTKTSCDNGVSVYVNFNDVDFEVNGLTVPAEDFRFVADA